MKSEQEYKAPARFVFHRQQQGSGGSQRAGQTVESQRAGQTVESMGRSGPSPAPASKGDIGQSLEEGCQETNDIFTDSSEKRICFQMSSSEVKAKKPKLEGTKPVKVETSKRAPRSEQPKPVKRRGSGVRDLNEEFWRRLAAEEERKKRLYPQPLEDSPWRSGGASRGGGRAGHRTAGQKRKLFSGQASGPQEL